MLRKKYLYLNYVTVPKSTYYRERRRERALRHLQTHQIGSSTNTGTVQSEDASVSGTSHEVQTVNHTSEPPQPRGTVSGEGLHVQFACSDEGMITVDGGLTNSGLEEHGDNIQDGEVGTAENDPATSSQDNVLVECSNTGFTHLEPREDREGHVKLKQREETLDSPLNELTSTTDGDALLMCLALGYRHSLSWAAIVDMLKMINVLFDRKVVKDTKYYVQKYTNFVRPTATYHVYCPKCERYLGQKKTEKLICECGWHCSNVNKAKNFFLSLDLKSQLQELLKNPVFLDGLNYRFEREKINKESFEDIFDGKIYQKHFRPGGLLREKYNMSYIFNTDGCAIGDSSRQTCWPIYLQIAELPPHLRSKFTILAGIYVGRKDPNMKLFLLPFVEEANSLSTIGIDWDKDGEKINSKVIPLCSCLDSVARCKVVNMNQFNGNYGCTLCREAPSKTPSGLRFTMPYKDIKERTHKGIVRCAQQALQNKILNKKETVVEGVKGPSPIHHMLHLNLVKGVRPDPMHNIFLGASRSSTELLLTPQFRPNHASLFIGIESKQACISQRLQRISPPSVITRSTRSIKESSLWKASEWRSWLLFYGVVCLVGLLDEEHVDHFSMLATAAHMLLQKSVSREDLDKASELIESYVTDYQCHFGETNMVFNVHLLLHIKKSVQYLGPLWTHSAFGFEGENRYLLQMKKSPSSVAQEIATKYTTFKALPSLCEKYASSDKAVDFCESLCERPLKFYVRCGGAVLVGNGNLVPLTDPSDDILFDLAAHGFSDLVEVKSFSRMLYKGARYTVESYSDGNQHDDSFISFRNQIRGRITNILRIKRNNGDAAISIFVHPLEVENVSFLSGNLSTLCPIKKIRDYSKVILIKPEEIVGQCVGMFLDHGNFICDVPYGCKGD